MKIKMSIAGMVVAVMALLVPRALAQSYYTNAVGYWNIAANWTNGAPAAGANLIFKRASVNTNDMANGSSFGWVDFNTANVTIRQSNAGYAYYFDALTNETGRNTAWAINTVFSNASITPVIADLGVSLTLSGVITNTSGNALVVTNIGATTISGGIAGTPGLTKYGSGTLTLSGANTFAGGVTLNAGTLTINNVAALGTGLLTINGGSLDSSSGAPLTNANNNAMTWAGNFTFAGTTNLHLGTGKVDLGTGTRTVTVIKNIMTVGGAITNSGSLTKVGAGTLVLSGDNIFTGSASLSAGTIKIGVNNSLPTSSTLAMGATGAATFDLTGVSQTFNTITFANNTSSTITGTGGALVLTGGLLYGATPGPITLNMSGLSNFSSSGGDFKAGGNGTSKTLTYNLAGNSSITAPTLTVGYGAAGIVTWNMGATTTINADTIVVGSGETSATLGYNAVNNPVLTLRGSGGGSSRVTTMTVGANCTTALMDTIATVSGGSDLEAKVTTLNIGSATTAATAGSLNMGGGTLDATTITIGKNTSTAAGQGTLSVAGGTVKVNTLTIADHPSGSGTPSGMFILGSTSSASALNAETVTSGAGTATRSFNWVNGTIGNYDVDTNLTIAAGLTLTLTNKAGTHVFAIDAGRTGIVNAVIAEAELGCGLVKTGAGLLILKANSTYNGLTTVSNGTLLVNNASGTGIAGAVVIAGGTLGGTGVVAGAVTNNSGGTLAPGNSVGTLTVGSLTLESGSTNSFEINDLVVVTTPGGLTINGGSVNLIGAGENTYNLIQYSGAISGNVTNLAVLNPVPNVVYTFGTNANYVTITLSPVSGEPDWLGNHSGNNWDTAANWSSGSVPGAKASVYFGTNTSSGTVDLNSMMPILSRVTFRAATNTTVQDLGGTPGHLVFDTLGGNANVSVEGGSHAISVGADLKASASITVGNAATLTISGAITNSTGAMGLTKDGAGTLTLSGSNSFGGGVTLSAGQLNLNDGGDATHSPLGTGSLTINGGTLDNTSGGARTISTANAQNWNTDIIFAGSADLNMGAGSVNLGTGARTVTVSNNTLTVAGSITNSGALIKAGVGTLALGGENTYNGGTTVSNGTLALSGGDNRLPTNGAITVTGGTLDLGGNAQATTATISFQGGTVQNGTLTNNTVAYDGRSGTVSANLVGSVGLTKNGGGTLILSGSNTFSGATTLSNGILRAQGNTSALGQSSGALVLNTAGTELQLADDAGLDFGRSATVSAAIQITSDRITSGAGVTNRLGALSIGPNTLTVGGGASVNSGVTGLTIGGTNTLTGAASFTVNNPAGGGTTLLTLNDINNSANLLTIGGGGNAVIAGNLGSGTTKTGGLTKNGAGTLTLANANSFSGDTLVSGGTLVLARHSAIQNSTLDTAGGGAIVLSSGVTNLVLGGLKGSTDLATAITGYSLVTALTLNPPSGRDVTYSGVIAEGATGMTLTKSGTGSQTLSRVNTFTGGASLSAGTLKLGVNNSLPISGTLTMGTTGAATLDLTGVSQTFNTITFAGNTSSAITGNGGTLVLTGGLTYSVGSGSQTLNMSGLSIFSSSGGDFKAGGDGSGRTLTFNLAGNSSISASTVTVGFGNSGATTWNMGTNTVIHADSIIVGDIEKSATMGFSAVNNPLLILRGSAGGSSRVTTMTVGALSNVNTSGGLDPIVTVDLVSAATGSSLDAMISTLSIGVGQMGNKTNITTGLFRMGAGTLDATTIIIGKNTQNLPTAAGTLSVAGGTVKVNTLTLADRPSGTGTNTGTFVLGSVSAASTLNAQTITNGAGATSATLTRNFHWVNGTVGNYDANTNLTIAAGLTLTLTNVAGTHAFAIDSGRTGTVNAVIAESEAGCGLVKTGTGLLILTTNNTYSGLTTVSNGTLMVNNVGGTGVVGAVEICSGATLGGTGVVAGAVTNTAGGVIAPGAGGVGTLTVGASHFQSGSTLAIQINSDGTPIADKLASSGVVDIDGATLSLSDLGNTKYPVVSMPEFVIIHRTSGSGTFANLSPGAYISLGKNLYTISYSGGTGADIVLNATPLVMGSVYKIR